MVYPGWVSGSGVSPGLNGRHDLNSQTYLRPSWIGIGIGTLGPGLEITVNIDGSMYVERHMASARIAATSEERSRLVVEETALGPAGCPIWRRPA